MPAGGLYAINPPVLDHVTVAFNTSETSVGGAILLRGGQVSSSILFGNSSGGGGPADLRTYSYAWAVTGGNDLVGDAGEFPLPPDTLHVDPLLLPLADNGGPTRTHALDAGSPAIDAGTNAMNLDFDQRGSGFARVSGVASDIGAFEFQTTADVIFADGFDRP